jgi:DNA-directed RNA polymerase specialized sigma24 family protein
MKKIIRYIDGKKRKPMKITYEDVKSTVSSLAHGMSKEDKEDLMQDVIVKLLESKADKITKGFVYRIVKSVLCDKYKKDSSSPDIAYTDKDYSGGLVPDYKVDEFEAKLQDAERKTW